MNFLTRFLKVFIFAVLLSALGALAFYWLMMYGSQSLTGLNQEKLSLTVRSVGGVWLGFVIFLSFILAITGMKKAISVPVHDRNIFLQRAHSAITGLRYRPSQQSDDLLIFKPPGVAVLAEKITVQLGPGSATITAPRGLLRQIQERL